MVDDVFCIFFTQRFQGGFHELVNDLERDKFKQLVLDWLNQHTSG